MIPNIRKVMATGAVAALVLLAGNSLAAKKHSYLFAWCGDPQKKASDFLAVFDSDPDSPKYGQLLATLPTGQSGTPHHTEAEMPSSGMLMANDFGLGRTWIFNLRNPLRPRIAASFGEEQGYMHPHTFMRLPNGHVLATFQYHGAHGPHAEGGGLLEMDDQGKVIRSGSAMDPNAGEELIRPYSDELVPSAGKIVTTNTAMHDEDGSSRTVQLWDAKQLRVLRTIVLPPGPRGDEQNYPGEPRLLEDGRSVLVHTFSCGLYLMRAIDTDTPVTRFVYGFPGKDCGVPVRTGHWWIATVPETHSLTVLDVSDSEHPREVSRLALGDDQKPHWASMDASGRRIVVNSSENTTNHRLFIVNFDPATGSLSLDERFRDAGSKSAGVSLDNRSWPHGFSGAAYAHGTVFSR